MRNLQGSDSLFGRAFAGRAAAVIVLLLAVAASSPAFGFCTSDADCDDGLFCNGVETCDLPTNSCVALSPCPPSIPPTVCNEVTDTCDSVLIFEDGFESNDMSFWSNATP